MNIPAPFSQNQKDYFDRTFTHWLNVAEGGKRGGKNVVNTLAFCTRLERHQSRIHLIAGVSTATAKINVLDCDGFGMKNFFEGRCREGEYKKRDCLYIQTPVGKIQTMGLTMGISPLLITFLYLTITCVRPYPPMTGKVSGMPAIFWACAALPKV